MKKHRVLALLGLFISSPALAEEAASEAHLSLQFQGLKLAQKQTSRKPDGSAEVKETYTSISTSTLSDSYVWLTLDKLNVYYYPFVDSGLYASAGYRLTDGLELGATLGWNTELAKESGKEYRSYYVAPFAWYYGSIGSYGWEQGLVLGRTSINIRIKDSLSGGTYSSLTTSTSLQYSTQLLIPLAKNFWMTSGFTIVFNSSKTKDQPAGEEEAETTAAFRSYALNLAGFRITL